MRATYFSHYPTTLPLTEQQPACPPSSCIEPSNDDVMGSWETSYNERTVFYEGILFWQAGGYLGGGYFVSDRWSLVRIRIHADLGTPS